jgi:Fe-S-cluster-containing dehydrogenase component
MNNTDNAHEWLSLTRRDFIKGVGLGSGAIVLLGQFGIQGLAWALEGEPQLKMVLVDYTKCTGCRTCETACSARNRPVAIAGKELPGLGNPRFANIRVHSFNPDVDVPSVCSMCSDTPCVKACPVNPDAKTGRRALYRDQTTHTIHNDPNRCIGCQSCAKACAKERTGVITPNAVTGKPERMCTLCGGDPQCVKLCPFGALSYVEVRSDRKFYGLGPEKIAAELAKGWYGTAEFGGMK